MMKMTAKMRLVKKYDQPVMTYYGDVHVYIQIMEGENYTPFRHASVIIPEKGFQIIRVLDDFAYDQAVHDYVLYKMKPREWVDELDAYGDKRYQDEIRYISFYLPLN